LLQINPLCFFRSTQVILLQQSTELQILKMNVLIHSLKVIIK